ncbi:MAG: hypothetical protein JW759_05685 [Candidatus Coatesbacteria bacterium]|nr:hypothetical protein [Candidatus Coatesbacteria bacterium]
MTSKGRRSSPGGCGCVILVVILIVAAICAVSRCALRVPKGHVAVLMSEVGGVGDGLRDGVLHEGLHFYNPLATDYFVVNTAAQTLVFGAEEQEPGPGGAGMAAADYWRQPSTGYWNDDRGRNRSQTEIGAANVEMRSPESAIRTKTKDGEDVELSATLVFRVSEQGAPQFVRSVGADASKLLDVCLIPGARSAIRTVFGQLASESFFDSAERAAKSEECLSELNKLLGSAGVTVERFTLDHFAFDQEFHAYLQDLKILNERIGSVEGQRQGTLDQLKEELQRAIATAKLKAAAAERQVETAKADAHAALEQTKRQVEAVQLRVKHEADLARERAFAMSGPGGEAALKLELARALRGKPILIVPDDAADVGASLPELLKMLSEPQQVRP